MSEEKTPWQKLMEGKSDEERKEVFNKYGWDIILEWNGKYAEEDADGDGYLDPIMEDVYYYYGEEKKIENFYNWQETASMLYNLGWEVFRDSNGTEMYYYYKDPDAIQSKSIYQDRNTGQYVVDNQYFENKADAEAYIEDTPKGVQYVTPAWLNSTGDVIYRNKDKPGEPDTNFVPQGYVRGKDNIWRRYGGAEEMFYDPRARRPMFAGQPQFRAQRARTRLSQQWNPMMGDRPASIVTGAGERLAYQRMPYFRYGPNYYDSRGYTTGGYTGRGALPSMGMPMGRPPLPITKHNLPYEPKGGYPVPGVGGTQQFGEHQHHPVTGDIIWPWLTPIKTTTGAQEDRGIQPNPFYDPNQPSHKTQEPISSIPDRRWGLAAGALGAGALLASAIESETHKTPRPIGKPTERDTKETKVVTDAKLPTTNEYMEAVMQNDRKKLNSPEYMETYANNKAEIDNRLRQTRSDFKPRIETSEEQLQRLVREVEETRAKQPKDTVPPIEEQRRLYYEEQANLTPEEFDKRIKNVNVIKETDKTDIAKYKKGIRPAPFVLWNADPPFEEGEINRLSGTGRGRFEGALDGIRKLAKLEKITELEAAKKYRGGMYNDLYIKYTDYWKQQPERFELWLDNRKKIYAKAGLKLPDELKQLDALTLKEQEQFFESGRKARRTSGEVLRFEEVNKPKPSNIKTTSFEPGTTQRTSQQRYNPMRPGTVPARNLREIFLPPNPFREVGGSIASAGRQAGQFVRNPFAALPQVQRPMASSVQTGIDAARMTRAGYAANIVGAQFRAPIAGLQWAFSEGTTKRPGGFRLLGAAEGALVTEDIGQDIAERFGGEATELTTAGRVAAAVPGAAVSYKNPFIGAGAYSGRRVGEAFAPVIEERFGVDEDVTTNVATGIGAGLGATGIGAAIPIAADLGISALDWWDPIPEGSITPFGK